MPLKKGQRILVAVLASLGVLLLVIGIAVPLIIESKLTSGIHDMVIVDSFDSPGFTTWENNTSSDSPATYMKFYIYNVTNPEEVYAGQKPILQEIGPYAYREYNVKFNISFSDDGNERSYRLWEYFEFDASQSFAGASPDSDRVTVVNVPLQGVLGALVAMDTGPNSDWWKSLLVDSLAAYTESTLVVTVNATQLMWGYTDPMLNLLSKVAPATSAQFQLQVNSTSADQVYLTTNLTVERTGKAALGELGEYVQFKGRTTNDCWATDYANQIRGTHGDAFPPALTDSSTPVVYVDNLFRSSQLASGQGLTVQGIELLGFGLPDSDMKNASEIPENSQWYQFGPSGTLNLTRCQGGAPVFISKPHFLDGDSVYRDPFSGVAPPSVELHDTVIGVEPLTGVVMSAHKRLQVNVKVAQDGMLYPGVALEPLYWPVAWVDETGSISVGLAEQFKDKVYAAQTMRSATLWGGLGGAGVLLAASVITTLAFYRFNVRRPRDYSRINEDI
jgi:hypothetical protein